MFFAIIVLVIGSVTLLAMTFIPWGHYKLTTWHEKKERTVEKQLDDMFYDKSPKKIIHLYYILPPVLGIGSVILFKSSVFFFIGAIIGLSIPNIILKIRNSKRRFKFNNQILDAIMILSSALKGGLSLLQGLEVVMEELPVPMSQEIGLVVRENKMGVTLEDSLKNLNKRINMEELTLVINSILVARETGGDLTKVLSRLTTTIRDNRKLKDSIKTLTLQGRLQGIIMSLLPILFVFWVAHFNRHHFDIMLKNETGRMLLFAAVILQLIGMILIKRFSTIKI